ncbi:hypothetical protein CKM354_000901800 [Cercospora kikuchii]|uniref:Uncharacterized protein n=1 Tax=Cercospora kikuchii TaxID=84275 RepID=A0A9P3FK31_9PEZI|nr:uncharacterized protein CKM354_000901800 [Cercospora kikuchii]GIZ45870.1 hypothetical protein CKM354_000901800 [Cercospora kikuchii]
MQFPNTVLLILGFTGLSVLARHSVEPRQNDVPECINGVEGNVGKIYDFGAECADNCFANETEGGYRGTCKGRCQPFGRPEPQFECRGSPRALLGGSIDLGVAFNQ